MRIWLALTLILLTAVPSYAGKISARSSATTLDGTETIGIIQGGVDKKTPLASVRQTVTTTFGCTVGTGGCTVYSLPQPGSVFAPGGLTNPGHTPHDGSNMGRLGDILMNNSALLSWMNTSGSSNYNWVGMLDTNAMNFGVGIGGYFGYYFSDVLKFYIERNASSGAAMLNFHTQSTFATLGTAETGVIQYCSDCIKRYAPANEAAAVCASGGSGAFARGVNSGTPVWVCD